MSACTGITCRHRASVRSLDHQLDLLRLRLCFRRGEERRAGLRLPDRRPAGCSSKQTREARGGGLCAQDGVMFTAVFVAPVYILPGAEAHDALKELHDHISSLHNKHPESFYMVAGNFNHIDLTNTLPEFYQHVTKPAQGNSPLGRAYTNI
ncbi:hypothetical protein AOLI_G00053970 [Acnodon oligacanthus]